MKTNLRQLTLVLVFTALSGCAGQHKYGDVSSEIHGISKQQGEMISKRDAVGIAGLYTSSAEIFPPNVDLVKGTQDIQRYWQSSFSDEPVTASVMSTEIESCGDMAWEVGNYKIAAVDGTTVDKGKYVTIWKFQDGKWKLHRDIFNSDLPATPK